MIKILEKLKEIHKKGVLSRIKHLRGRHDQLDHAWNRGMGGGGAGGAATGGLSKMMKYRQTRSALLDMVRTGDMTRTEAREQLRAMRDTLGDMGPTRREQFAAGRVTGGLTAATQSNVMMNQTKRIPPKAKTGEVSRIAPMPIDASEFVEGGRIYEYIVNNPSIVNGAYERYITKSKVAENAIFNKQGTLSGNSSQGSATRISDGLYMLRDDISKNDDILFATDNYDILPMYANQSWVEQNMRELRNLYNIQNEMNMKTNDAAERIGPSDYIDLSPNNGATIKSIIVPDDVEANNRMFKILRSGFDNPESALYFLASDIIKKNQLENEIEILNKLENIDSNFVSEERKKRKSQMQDELKSLNESIADSKKQFEDARKDIKNVDMYMADEWNGAFSRFENIVTDSALMNEMPTPVSLKEAINSSKNKVSFAVKPSQKVGDLIDSIAKFFSDENNNVFVKSLIKRDNGVIDKAFNENGADFIVQELKVFNQAIEDLTKKGNDFFNEINEKNALNHADKDKFNSVINSMNKAHKFLQDNLNEEKVSTALQSLEQVKPDSMSPESVVKYFFENAKPGRTQYTDQPSVEHVQRALALVYDMQSFNGDATVGSWGEITNPSSDVQTDTNGNPLIMWRSVKGVNMYDPTSTDRGLQYVEEMRTGENHYPGAGVSGFGTYMKTGNIYGENTSLEPIVDTNEYVEHTTRRMQTAQSSIQNLFGKLKESQEGLDALGRFNGESKVDNYFKNLSDYLRELEVAYNSGNPLMSNIGDAKRVAEGNLNLPFSLNSLKRLMGEQSQFTDALESYMNSPSLDGADVAEIKSLYNQAINDIHVLASGLQPYTKQEAKYQNAKATRDVYGDYTAGYTVNKDARMPATFVNDYNSGNANHISINSMDEQIDNEFKKRYPLLDSGKVNIGVKMAILGYDAYYAHLNEFSTNIIVLNRAILNMPDTTLMPSTTESDIKNLINTGQPPASVQR
jgi:hypothetical protein